MKQLQVLLASCTLYVFTLSPTMVLAEDDIDVTMEVIDDLDDLEQVAEMRGPEPDDEFVGDEDDCSIGELGGDEFADDERGDRSGFEDDFADNDRDDDGVEDDFEDEGDFEQDEEVDENDFDEERMDEEMDGDMDGDEDDRV